RQVINVAMLPGVVRYSIAMPDIHWGYGFPIGGVAAFDAKEGIISPGGVGYDINCGVSLLAFDIEAAMVRKKLKDLVDVIFHLVPSGMGATTTKIRETDLREILATGLRWAIENSKASNQDRERVEENGEMQGADAWAVSKEALSRGIKQLGTLGAGNHFLEVQEVSEIYDESAAESFGLRRGMTTVMVHTGSRGLGHQVATDFIASFRRSKDVFHHPVDDQLISVQFDSEQGQKYLSAMNAAANFAFVNRQIILDRAREAFRQVFGSDIAESGHLVYSISHNMAKVENHTINGESRRLVVHRKGATRAFPAELIQGFNGHGHPVLVPGDMGSASYVLEGIQENLAKSFGSSCHGAGRALSRKKSLEKFDSSQIKKSLLSRGIYVKAQSNEVISEEAPGSYKNVDEVVEATVGAGLAKKVARLVPMGVVKG
ncbi:RtcB family protein, partial [Thermoplasmatales archaeon AK]|nr:RtcB family protein [Thermoplasmatales archaeon AK]